MVVERDPLIIESKSKIAAQKVGKYFLVFALLFMLWDIYTLIRHGHIIGGVFMAIICLLIASIGYTFKAKSMVSSTSYRTDFRIAGIPMKLEHSIKGWEVIQIEYDALYVRGGVGKHPCVIQIYLLPRAGARLAHGYSLTSDVYFDKGHDPVEVSNFIRKVKDATGFKVVFGKGPMRDIYPTYQKLYGDA